MIFVNSEGIEDVANGEFVNPDFGAPRAFSSSKAMLTFKLPVLWSYHHQLTFNTSSYGVLNWYFEDSTFLPNIKNTL